MLGKFTEGASEQLAEGRSAIERALELNPDLPLAHNLYTNIQVDQGHAMDALKRLLNGCAVQRAIRSCLRASPTRAATAVCFRRR